MPDDELGGTLDGEVNDPATESDADKVVRLELENKSIKDGNSRLGREFKQYKEDNEDKYDALLERVSLAIPASPQTPERSIMDEYEDEDERRLAVIADQRLDKKLDERARKNKATNEKYISDYTKAAQALGRNEDDGMYESILAEMEGMTGFSDNGSEDALRHYQKAEGEVYKKKYRQASSGGENSAFRGEAPAGGVGGSSTIESQMSVDSGLVSAKNDPAVQDYMKWRERKKGNDPEFLKRALSVESKLSGKIRS
jgi:hypothetical protein